MQNCKEHILYICESDNKIDLVYAIKTNGGVEL